MEQQRQALATLPGLTTRGSVTATCRRPALGTALLRHEVADTLKITGSTLWPRMSAMARALLPAMTKGSSRCWCRWPQWSWLALMPLLALMPVTKVLLPCLCLFVCLSVCLFVCLFVCCIESDLFILLCG